MTSAIVSVAPKLGKLLRLLASDRPREVLATAAAITRTLKQAGADWHDLAKVLGRAEPHGTLEPVCWRDLPVSEQAGWLAEMRVSRRLSAREQNFSDVAYVEMWDRVVTEWRSRNDFRHLLDFGRSRSTILTNADLQRLLGYLEGAPEMQRDAIEAFKARQVERDAEAACRARRHGQGKQAARDFMAERRAFLKTLSKKGRSR